MSKGVAMKKGLWKELLVVSASFFVFMADAQQKPWTFLVYMTAANDLNASALLDLNAMMQTGSHKNVNIIVYLTLHENDQPKVTKKLYMEQGSMTQVGPTMVRDSGDMTTLVEALQWACVDYPSDHIAVLLWDHGSGPLNRSQLPPKGICYDCDTGYYLTDRDCLQAFLWARDHLRAGHKFDIIAFDASFLASVEIAYTLSSCADYLVASEDSILDNGYKYAYILEQLATQTFDSLSLAKCMVDAYGDDYVGDSGYTLSAVDLNGVIFLVNSCNIVAQILASQLAGKNKDVVKAAIKKCINTNLCPSFDEGIYIDLCQFYKNLLKNIDGLKLSKSMVNQFKQMLIDSIKLFPTIIKANVMSASYKQAVCGLSLYFSRYSLDPSYYGLYWTEQNPNWLNFLETFLT